MSIKLLLEFVFNLAGLMTFKYILHHSHKVFINGKFSRNLKNAFSFHRLNERNLAAIGKVPWSLTDGESFYNDRDIES